MISVTSAGNATTPITLADAKHYLYVTFSVEVNDALVASLVSAATTAFERYTGKFLLTQTVTQTMDRFPSCDTITLRKGPVQSVTSITAYAADGTTTVLDPDQYVIDAATKRIVLKTNASWPEVGQVAGGVKIVYTAGYGDDGDSLPAPILQGIRHLIAHFYENREVNQPIPPTVLAMWSSYRTLVV